MHRNVTVLVLALLLAACTARPVQKVKCPSAALVTPTENLTPTPKTEPISTLAATPVPSAQPKTTDAAPVAKEEMAQNITPAEPTQELSPAEKIANLRGTQTLSEPSPDEPSFEDEETISLEGRRLSPFAYEPITSPQTPAPWTGEQLKYGLYYSFIKAGTAYIKTRGVTAINGRQAYVIQTTAFSASVIDPFFKVRDVNYSWLDAENFYSLGYSQSVREGNYKRDEWLAFDYPANTYYGELQKKADPRTVSGPLSAPVLDMLTSLYFVRAQKLTPGQDVVFDIVNREKQYPLIVKVLKKETIKTAAGKFKCIVVEPQFRGEGIFVSKGKSLKVWLTDDEYKMPVKMKTEVFIGSVSAELLEYKRN